MQFTRDRRLAAVVDADSEFETDCDSEIDSLHKADSRLKQTADVDVDSPTL